MLHILGKPSNAEFFQTLSITFLSVPAFSERRGIECRAEAFNVTNTPPFQLDTRTTFNPGLPLNQQNFGRITSAGPGRQIQFALKLKLSTRC